MTIEIRGPFFRERYPFATVGRSRTKQSQKAECDVNNILKKFRETGIITHRNTYEGDYGDFTEVPSDYHEAMNLMRRADEMFLSIPADVRERFNNDAGQFLNFVQDPANAEEMYELKLARRPVGKQKAQPEAKPQTKAKPQSPASSEASGEA